MMLLRKVISGGQTGVDRAGLDAAIKAVFLLVVIAQEEG
jgi:putative molybdenum carrier protein